MLQWIPGSSEEVIWNAQRDDARRDNNFVSIIHNMQRNLLPDLPTQLMFNIQRPIQ